jgi:hypothetical protein
VWRCRIEVTFAVVASLALAWAFHATVEQRRLNDALMDAVVRRDTAAAEHWRWSWNC